ncbi:MAG: hypothetical protein HY559_01745 [Gammaproteobacteria bacterium]|nr:hypothetical protein [Gammaproteobacteria bacterium]
MDGKSLLCFCVLFITLCEASGLPLRRAEFLVGSENDSMISGNGFWKGDDEGYTFSESFAASFLWEDVEKPHSDVFKCTLVAHSFLFNRFEGSDTDEGARRQFSREWNTLFFEGQWGRTRYVRCLLGIQDINFEPTGRGFLTTTQQFAFHKASRNSQDVENLDAGRSNAFSVMGGLGMGGETPLWPSSDLAERLLIRGDLGSRFDFMDWKKSSFEWEGLLLLGISKITEGTLSLFVFRAGVNGSLSYEGIQVFAELGCEWNLPLSSETYLTVRPRARVPVISTVDDFYDPNPEMVLGVVIGLGWDTG